MEANIDYALAFKLWQVMSQAFLLTWALIIVNALFQTLWYVHNYPASQITFNPNFLAFIRFRRNSPIHRILELTLNILVIPSFIVVLSIFYSVLSGFLFGSPAVKEDFPVSLNAPDRYPEIPLFIFDY